MRPPVTATVTNVVVAGLGGQGVLKASDILADVAFRAGLDVKKSEVHGMSQRGGSVNSDVRFGGSVQSPMIPAGTADFVVVIAEDQVEINRPRLRSGGKLIAPDSLDAAALANKKSLNVALLGCLSTYLDLAESFWLEAIQASFPPELHPTNVEAFRLGRASSAGKR